MSSGNPPPPPPYPPTYGYVQPQYPQGPGGAPRKSRTGLIVTIVAGGLVLLVVFVAGLLAFLLGMMKSSEPYQHAVQVATHDSRVVKALGAPVTTGWFFTGSINVSGPGGNADLAIPLSGIRQKGTLYVVAKKSAGRWTYETLEVRVDGQEERVNLLPEPNSQPTER